MRVTSGDAQIAYHVLGQGPPVVLLHPFPVNHQAWLPAAGMLSTRYRVLLPDLRGHGDSTAGSGPATMEKHAADVVRVCDDAGVARAVFAGVSIGGYILFEFWRRYPQRITALVLCNTRAQAETPQSRATRLQSAEDVLQRGSEPFIEGLIPRLLGRSTQQGRPDLVQAARKMMRQMSPQGISAVQRGMAERPDSVATLPSIKVPTLLLAGEEDVVSPVADLELMRQNIGGSQLRVIAKAGHYAVFEQHEAAGKLLRQFLDSLQQS